jgi:hypothetical protein
MKYITKTGPFNYLVVYWNPVFWFEKLAVILLPPVILGGNGKRADDQEF